MRLRTTRSRSPQPDAEIASLDELCRWMHVLEYMLAERIDVCNICSLLFPDRKMNRAYKWLQLDRQPDQTAQLLKLGQNCKKNRDITDHFASDSVPAIWLSKRRQECGRRIELCRTIYQDFGRMADAWARCISILLPEINYSTRHVDCSPKVPA